MVGQTRRAGAALAGFAIALALAPGSAARLGTAQQTPPPGEQVLVRLDPRFDGLVPPDARLEKLAEGFVFIEGPVWDRRNARLFFSDVRGNAIHQWTASTGASIFKSPFFDGSTEGRRTWGPNGLTFDAEGRLVISDQGRRQITRIERDGSYTVLADRWQGKRLNSPNDVVYGADGSLYFTDPPYGLEGLNDSPLKELDFNGIFRLRRDGTLQLLWRDQNSPNGLALTPDGRTLVVANSAAPLNWMAYDIGAETLSNPRVLATASGGGGVPDGMKIDRTGNVFSSGPGGVWVIAPDGTHLGTIRVPEVPANVGWGDDGRSLYITARTGLYRIRVATSGLIP